MWLCMDLSFKVQSENLKRQRTRTFLNLLKKLYKLFYIYFANDCLVMLDDSLRFAFINLHHLSIKDNLKTNLGQFTTTITTFVIL